ncbi:MAG: flavodoxin domain-containing protein [Paracoccaceae bacterium]|nr:flavodoxin domain-containing protein [Paracoccaceae bacterium]
MNVLVIYGTVEGQTKKIAEFVADHCRSEDHTVEIFDTATDPVTASVKDFDKVVLAASVHERRHPRDFEAFVSGYQDDLAERDTMMLSVSLNAAFPAGMEEAQDYLVEMKMRTGLEPIAELLVAGAVRQATYDYYAKQVLQHVVLRDHDFDPTKGDYEFTDWDALTAALKGFLSA